MQIAGKVAVVNGGGSGIGRAAVLALVQRGAWVVVADVDERGGRQTVDLAVGNGGSDLQSLPETWLTPHRASSISSRVV